MERAIALSACVLAVSAAACWATQVIVGGNELQSLYPFRCC